MAGYDRQDKKPPPPRTDDLIESCKQLTARLIEMGYTTWTYEFDTRVGTNRCPACWEPGQCGGSRVVWFIYAGDGKWILNNNCGCDPKDIVEAMGFDPDGMLQG